jgi:hypothetical protein
MADAIRGAGFEVAAYPDLYRALARVCGCRCPELSAVVVCVDGLDADQFEFFQIASRRQRAVPLYAYAPDHAGSSIELAIRSGAAGGISPETVERVLAGAAEVAPQPQTVRSTDNGRSTPHETPAATVGEQSSHEAASDAITKVPAEAADDDVVTRTQPTNSVRVPWLRYEGGPKRTPPQKAAKPSPEPEPAAAEPEPPLLTPEEIEALIGDQDADSTVSEASKPKARKPKRRK